jgi:hypothetical protein
LKLRRDSLAEAEKVAVSLTRSARMALRIVVNRSELPWAKRPFLGELTGVWVLAAIWILVVVLALTVFG